MITKAASAGPFAGAAAADPSAASAQQSDGGSGKAPDQPAVKSQPKASAAPQVEPLLRLEIRHDDQGRYVYTLTDRNTGRTVVEIPREALARLSEDENYTAGSLVSTKA